jgi:glycine/D-amino acid oxidase-like deaminating enzyme/nitrite reductase/ring-hydroxylating ferredoxin subunit
MKSDSSNTVSIWMDTAEMPTRPPLTKNARADVCVVGAGLAGVTTAYLLGKAGKRVILIDDGPIGAGETSRTTAHIAPALDDMYYEIEKVFGEDGARQAAESHESALNRIEAIVKIEDIDCDFRRVDGYLFGGADGIADLERELEATHRAGLADTQIIARAPLDFWNSGPCLRFPRQGQFHPLKYLNALVNCIERDGGRIFTGSRVEGVHGGSPVNIETADKHTISATAAVVATNSPISDRFIPHARMAPYRTFVVGFSVPKDAVPYGLYWDMLDPYHYVRIQPKGDEDILIVGGEDHKTGQADDAEARFRRIEAWSRERFSMAGAVKYRWSGQVMEPTDYMAFIGRDHEAGDNVYVITGDSGNGMTHCTIGGMLCTDLIMGRENPWEELYKLTRVKVSLSSVAEFAKENLNVALQYTDYVKKPEVSDAAEIAPGTGAVIERDGKRIAAYCDEDGAVHEHSAVCPHLKCIVQWNSLETSWDCPCHGSRFDAYGRLLNGPAAVDLEKVEG